jgi:hypothetical protein
MVFVFRVSSTGPSLESLGFVHFAHIIQTLQAIAGFLTIIVNYFLTSLFSLSLPVPFSINLEKNTG